MTVIIQQYPTVIIHKRFNCTHHVAKSVENHSHATYSGYFIINTTSKF